MNVISFKLIEKVGGNQTAFEVISHPHPPLKKCFKIFWNTFIIFMVIWFDNWITAVAPGVCWPTTREWGLLMGTN